MLPSHFLYHKKLIGEEEERVGGGGGEDTFHDAPAVVLIDESEGEPGPSLPSRRRVAVRHVQEDGQTLLRWLGPPREHQQVPAECPRILLATPCAPENIRLLPLWTGVEGKAHVVCALHHHLRAWPVRYSLAAAHPLRHIIGFLPPPLPSTPPPPSNPGILPGSLHNALRCTRISANVMSAISRFIMASSVKKGSFG